MEWPVVLALVLAIPIILVGVAFVWYLNASGLYQVIRDVRQRQRRRAGAVREAEHLARGPAEVAGPRKAA